MDSVTKKRLFWFLKEDADLNLSNEANRNMYIQQIITKGNTSNISELFKAISIKDFVESFNHIKIFLPREVKKFWEDFIGDINQSSKNNTQVI